MHPTNCVLDPVKVFTKVYSGKSLAWSRVTAKADNTQSLDETDTAMKRERQGQEVGGVDVCIYAVDC
jgi:hypothetical protein